MDPEEVYDDDPVRILRAIRFAARLGWEIDPAAYRAICNNTPRLNIVSPERTRSEVEKMMAGPDPLRAFGLLEKTGALEHSLPELQRMVGQRQDSEYHDTTVWEHTLNVLGDLESDDPRVLWAALLHDVAKSGKDSMASNGKTARGRSHSSMSAAVARGLLRRLRFQRDFIDEVCFMISHHSDTKRWGNLAEKATKADIRYLQCACRSPQRLARLLTLIDADNRNYRPGHRMPDQAAAILRRSRELEETHEDMFSYSLPFSDLELSAHSGLKKPRDLRRLREDLIRLVAKDPQIKRKQLLGILAKMYADIPHDPSENVESKPSRKKRHNRRYRHQRKPKTKK